MLQTQKPSESRLDETRRRTDAYMNAAEKDSACALHAITEYAILWVANVVIKFGTRKAPQGASLGGFSVPMVQAGLNA